MKIKKIGALCTKRKYMCIYEHTDSVGNVVQWLGDGMAFYPMYGLPRLDKSQLFTMFDVAEKDENNYLYRCEPVPEGITFADYDANEGETQPFLLGLHYGGIALQPYITHEGVTIIQQKYLAPLADEQENLEIYQRITAKGTTYLVAKAGMCIRGLFWPETALSTSVVANIELLADGCYRTLTYRDTLRKRQREVDTGQESEQTSIDNQ